MLKQQHMKNLALVVLLIMAAIVNVQAEQQKVLKGSELLKAIREKSGHPDKPAYGEETEHYEKTTTDANITPEPQKNEYITHAEETEKPEITTTTTYQPAKKAQRLPSVDVLEMIPGNAMFVIRINNLEATLANIDQFIKAVSPMPMGLSMLLRMKLAEILGNAELAGIDMNGTFAAFINIFPGKSMAQTDFVYIIAPVSNFQQFASGNPNCTDPDENGVCKISTDGSPFALIKPLSTEYALVASPDDYERFMKIARRLTDIQNPISSILTPKQQRQSANEPIWLFCDVTQTTQTLGPMIAPMIQKQVMAMPTPGSMNNQQGADAQNMDISFSAPNDLKQVAVAINPKTDLLLIHTIVRVSPGSETALKLQPDSTTLQQIKLMTGAVKPQDVDPNTRDVLQLLPGWDSADLVGKFNLLNLMKMGAAMAPGSVPDVNVQAKNAMAFAFTYSQDNIDLDLALPKAHFDEVAAAQMAARQKIIKRTEKGFSTKTDANTGRITQMPQTPSSGQTLVEGTIKNTNITLDKATLNQDILTIYTGDSWASNPSIVLFLDTHKKTIPAGEQFTVSPDSSEPAMHLHIRYKDPTSDSLKTIITTKGYTLKLSFSRKEAAALPGEIELRYPEENLELKGNFVAYLENQQNISSGTYRRSDSQNTPSTRREPQVKNKFDAEETVTIIVTNVEDEETKEEIAQRIKRMLPRRENYMKHSLNDSKLNVEAAPVKNIKAFARHIPFGKVTKLDGNTITVELRNIRK